MIKQTACELIHLGNVVAEFRQILHHAVNRVVSFEVCSHSGIENLCVKHLILKYELLYSVECIGSRSKADSHPKL